MDQGETAPMLEGEIGPWGSTRNGYCTGLTVRWVAKHYNADEFPFNRKTQELADLDLKSIRDHNYYRDDPATFPVDYGNALQRYKQTIAPGTQLHLRSLDLETIFNKVYNENCCYLILLTGKSGGHTVALSVRHLKPLARWYYFDSNEGSFQFEGRNDAIRFLKELFRYTGYRTRYSELYAVGVNRPAVAAM